jgi:NAD+ synthase (glutamine-hydrolysing)
MKTIKVAAAVLNQTPLAWKQNERNIREAIARARAEGCSILCLPELSITGYGCEDAFHSAGVHERAWKILESLLPDTQGMIVSFGLPTLHQTTLFNTACLVVDAHIAGLVAKKYLAGDGIHYEPRWFKPWPRGVRALTRLPSGKEAPLGDLYFDVGGVRIGFEICEDAWVADRPGVELSRRGIDVLLNPSASHFAFGKIDVRKRFVIEGSRAFGASYVYANLLGNEAGRAIYDGGALIASGGRLAAIGSRLGFHEVEVTSAVVDVSLTRMSQARTASFKPDLSDEGDRCVRVPFDYPSRASATTVAEEATWESSAERKEEEFARAEALALYDYLRKSRSNGFVISLSGGADSAAAACLVSLMVELGTASIGLDAFKAKLAHIPRLGDLQGKREIVRALLTTIYQATENSGPVTKNAARTIAESLGARHLEIDIDAMQKSYVNVVSDALSRKLDWRTDDIALQNIQARCRSPGAWLVANLENALLLATSNRSEAAVGYATMDGDTSGGLSPLAGIDKAFLLRWIRWLHTKGPKGGAPIPSLEVILVQQPTAELRPPSACQTDESDLMPYPLLDAIERSAIRDKRTPLEALLEMRATFPQYALRDLGIWVERFYRLWCRNQWKRERYAPSFHLDDENLDPKTWCRFPILSGGYEEELAELRSYVAANA